MIHYATCDCTWVASDDACYLCMKALWKKKLKPMIFVEGYFCPPTLFLIAVGFELVAMLAV